MMNYLPRLLESVLARRLRQTPVLILTGARQTGKSTLAQHFPGARGRTYRTLDDLDNLELAESTPEALFSGRKPVTLDEVQRAPSILLAIKRDVDRARRAGRFLLTGSANLLLMRRVSETLAGRAHYLTLWPLTEAECRSAPLPKLWEELFSAHDTTAAGRLRLPVAPGRFDLDRLILRGGYPPAVTAPDEDARRLWLDGYVRTYLERDLQQLSQIDALVDFRRLMRVAALRVGQLLNQAELARDAGLSSATTHRYLNLLEVSYQIYRLPAYAVNRTKRLIKAPKLFWTDAGLAAYMAGADNPQSLGPMRGALLENLVLCQLLAWRETQTPRPEICYWRTAAGEEVDLIIEWRGRLLPIEVKASSRVRPSDARHIDSFAQEYPDLCPFGVVLYTGREIRQLSGSSIACPVACLS